MNFNIDWNKIVWCSYREKKNYCDILPFLLVVCIDPPRDYPEIWCEEKNCSACVLFSLQSLPSVHADSCRFNKILTALDKQMERGSNEEKALGVNITTSLAVC